MKKDKKEKPLSFEEAQAILSVELDLAADPEFVSELCKATIVEDIWQAMRDSGLNQSKLARLLGKSRQYINQILNEEINLTIESIAAISVVLHRQLVMRMIRHDEFMPILATSRLETIKEWLAEPESMNVAEPANGTTLDRIEIPSWVSFPSSASDSDEIVLGSHPLNTSSTKTHSLLAQIS